MEITILKADKLKEVFKEIDNIKISLVEPNIVNSNNLKISFSTKLLKNSSLIEFLTDMSIKAFSIKNKIKELEKEREVLPVVNKILSKDKYKIKTEKINSISKNFKINSNIKVLADGKNIVNLSEMASTEYWLNGAKKMQEALRDGALKIADETIMETINLMSSWFNGSSRKNTLEEYDYNRLDPIQILKNRNPDFFSNMYNISGISIGGQADSYWAARIEGIDIPMAKRSTTKRSFCGREIEVVGSEIELNKVCTLRFALDQEYICFYENLNEANRQTKMTLSRKNGLLYNFLHDYKKCLYIYVDYSDLYTSITENSDGKVYYNFKSKNKDFIENKPATSDLYKNIDDKYKNKFTNTRSGAANKRFVFENVKFIAENASDLEYDSQSANELTGEIKFIYQRMEEFLI